MIVNQVSSYRTYEEWKPLYNTIKTFRIQWVLTVPMRNGNTTPLQILSSQVKFLPYLWGMETLFRYFFLHTLTSFLPYLWGMETPVRTVSIVYFPKFLPYLWGMETWKGYYISQVSTSVLTVPMRNGNPARERSMPSNCFVLTVPMRNGNRETSEKQFFQMWVLTVPMRNGNITHLIFLSHHHHVLTVPMRNGNCNNSPLPARGIEFLPYLWGMETESTHNTFPSILKVLTVPMRNGNSSN